jgi:protein involved in polysaccharide export with SLBB domain
LLYSYYHPARLALAVVLVVLSCTVSAQDGGYRLQDGDSISVTIYPFPELSGAFLIDERGQFKMPLLDPITAAGKTSEEIRDSITEQLREQVDGKVEVSVSVAEYRPVYIDGDVMAPGALPYRPGMTVTIAVTLAGGRQSVRASGSLLNLSREQEQFEQLLDAYRVQVARETRLRAELAGDKQVRFSEDFEIVASSNPRVQEILENERSIMASRLNLQAIKAEGISQRIKGLKEVILELESQKETIENRRKLYERQFETIKDIAGQGIVPKATLLRLEITATTLEQEARAADIRLINSRQSLGEAQTQLKNLPIELKAEIAAALQEVQDSMATTRIQFDQSSRRLAALNAQAPPELAPDVKRADPGISISRVTGTVESSTLEMKADWDTPVLPGDVIRIPYPEFSAPGGFESVLPGRLEPSAN